MFRSFSCPRTVTDVLADGMLDVSVDMLTKLILDVDADMLTDMDIIAMDAPATTLEFAVGVPYRWRYPSFGARQEHV